MGDIKEKGIYIYVGEEVYDPATWMRASSYSIDFIGEK